MEKNELVKILNMKLSDKFKEGKHKGKTLEEVYTKDPGYISWMINKVLVTSNQDIKIKGNQHLSLYAEDLEEYYNKEDIDPSNPLDFYENDFINY